jgi:hypothetical protein
VTTVKSPKWTVIGCALAGGVALFAATRTWTVETVVRAAPLPPLETPHTGSALQPALPALALVVLAGAGGLLAARGRGRAVVAGLILAAGLGLAGLAAPWLPDAPGWATLTVLAGLGAAAAGAWALRNGQAWRGLGARYERPREAAADKATDKAADEAATRHEAGNRDLWDAIERGEDPTKYPHVQNE